MQDNPLKNSPRCPARQDSPLNFSPNCPALNYVKRSGTQQSDKWRFSFNFKVSGDWVMTQKLKFYDVKAKQAFETDKYEVVEKNTARGPMIFAVATSPYTGIKIWRLIGKKK